VTAVSSGPHCPLDIVFVTTPAHLQHRAWIPAGGVGGKEPRPTLLMGCVGIFLGQQPWQCDRNSLGFILGCVRFGHLQLPLQGWGQTVRKQDHAALVAFCLMDVKAVLFEVDVFDTQVEGLAHSQPAGVEEMDDEAGRVTVDIRHTGQELEHVLAVRARMQGFMSFGAQGIDGSQFLFDTRAVEEQQRVEGLVLGGGADTREGQFGKEGLDFEFRGEGFKFWVLEEGSVADEPVE